ncbi:MAG: hypothetical protein GY952_12285 [Rhodobacteraceae bacterium]|nr:hypothetical protein [Paracoccaceae bacterium]
MRKVAVLTALVIPQAGRVWAHHDKTPLREAVLEGHSHDVGGATIWLAVAAVAMIVALVAVQKSVFRKK